MMRILSATLLLSLSAAARILAAPSGPGDEPQRAIPLRAAADLWREDLRFMAREMPRRHRNLFHTMTREQFESAVRSLDERIPTLARHQVIVELMRIVAMVGDGHTNIAPTRDPKIGFHSLPVLLYQFRDGLFIRAAARSHADLVGARVVRIGHAPVEDAYRAARELVGRDNEMDAKFFAPYLLAMPEVLHALGLTEDADRAVFVVERAGVRKTVTLEVAGPVEMMAPDTDVSWAPRAGWVDARDSATSPPPLWLRDPRNQFWFEYLVPERTVYVQFNQVGNKKDESVEAFSKRLFEFVDGHPVERLVLDLRLNRGGNGALNRPLVRAIIRSRQIDQKGRLFVLIGRSTWSAAQMLVNELERYTNAIFVGEPSGGKVNSYGDSTRITLPNSGITVRVSTLWWQGDERDRRPWTAPSIAADLGFEDYRGNRDPAFAAALAWVPAESLGDLLTEPGTGAEAGARYRKWRADPVHAYVDTQDEVNAAGYRLLAAKRFERAIEVFKLNVEAFPGSANAHDSLGDAYLTAGDREAAIRSYERALALDPNMPSALDALKRLGR